jgi:cell division protein FtsW (lipid II flippase)
VIRDYQKQRVLTFLNLPSEIALLELYGGILLLFLVLAALMFAVRSYRSNRPATVGLVFLAAGLSVGSALCFDAFHQAREAAIAKEGPSVKLTKKLKEIREEYQPRQSEIAIGAGGVSGRGYKQGSQTQLRFLPIAWTDYIFSVFSEEHGFIGAVFLIALFLALVMWALKIAATARDRFGGFVAAGCAAFFFWHVVINIAMVTRLLPVVGVTLPLFSHGGSSLITSMLALGLLAHVSFRRTGAAYFDGTIAIAGGRPLGSSIASSTSSRSLRPEKLTFTRAPVIAPGSSS